ncbi:ZYRO0C10472p [Zygosaccharomyces rouxii]|uniref:ZYRO0C10472p n=2 Tax=Zygosaccharomyces rouxii TaxID=4956 RepID=C5DTQ6_ZYGRC|nr:uncharacterized protein ZYRO0C10472g [Zygosaccharomyces rouxii]KAH9201656.1 hypothetical protein LQ764DRAFT_82081 [Zygosaccharomyces rouxii]CAR27167.1 ZYRO0C10472p [Zygosaccharomyces rouxii]
MQLKSMVKRRIELQELERNSLSLKEPLSNEPALKVSKSETKEKYKEKRITVVMGWKEAHRISEILTMVSISKNGDNSASLTCLFDGVSFKKVWNKGWITIRTGKPVFEEELTILSTFSISRDRLYVTILSDSIETLLADVGTNLKQFEQTSEPQLPRCLTPPVSVNLPWRQSELSVIKSRIFNEELSLNKDQVTYLIGKNGARIEMIRQESMATIKILPISKRLTAKELNHPDIVIQSISITGDWYQVALAFAYIEANLQLYKLGPKRMLL